MHEAWDTEFSEVGVMFDDLDGLDVEMNVQKYLLEEYRLSGFLNQLKRGKMGTINITAGEGTLSDKLQKMAEETGWGLSATPH